MPVEPPGPSTERLAAWRALIERIRQGDRAEVLAWDEGLAAGPGATYQVLVTRRVRQRLRGAPPCWPARSPASWRSCGWIRPRPA